MLKHIYENHSDKLSWLSLKTQLENFGWCFFLIHAATLLNYSTQVEKALT
jgi:hypothetical protein